MKNALEKQRCIWRLGMPSVMLAALLCTGSIAQAAAPELESTESGAPSAIVMFPVTDKPSPFAAGMRPVVFNHLLHEQKVEDCETCHHTGDMQTCSSCHSVEGKEEGNFITLERAMHAENIAKRAGDAKTPVSCVSCHTQNLTRRECAGCHSIVQEPRAKDYCGTCHDVTPKMTKEQFMLGVKGELDGEENLALATETVHERSQKISENTGKLDVHTIPTTVVIDGISEKFEGNVFNHKRHYTSLLKRIGEDKLAAAFHSGNEYALCATCHHNSPPSATPPKCVTCHSPRIDPQNPGRPALKAAYHLQCMTCHDSMQVSRPQNTSCGTCHTVRKP